MNAKSYIEGILTPALVEMKKHFRDEVFTFQQDGAPSHIANKTQTWCEHHSPRFWRKELWPLSSPDLNPLDFCVWSILEKEACTTAHTNNEALKKSIKREWAKIPQQTFRAAAKSFRTAYIIILLAFHLKIYTFLETKLLPFSVSKCRKGSRAILKKGRQNCMFQ